VRDSTVRALAVDPATPAPNRGLHLNGATIMTTPTDRHVQIARSVGYAGVEVRAERLIGAPGELRRAASATRPGEVWSLNGIQIKIDPSGALRRDLLDDELPPRLAICRAVGAAYLLVVPPRIGGVDQARALDGVREGLAIVRDQAAAAGIRVAFEFLGFADCPIDSPALAAAVVGGVPGADLVIDSCHWHASGSQPLDNFPVDRLAMVHLNDAPQKEPRAIEDADRLLPGLGVIRLPELIASLRRAGYDGPWSVETFNPAYWERDPETVAREALDRTRTLLGLAVAD
jgi:sugar phosphate isomerase/epimerase